MKQQEETRKDVNQLDVNQLAETLKTQSLSQLASLIIKDWEKMSIHAKPYVTAMRTLHDMDSKYGRDDAKGIVLYFLSNAGSWRGEVARIVKTELRGRITCLI